MSNLDGEVTSPEEANRTPKEPIVLTIACTNQHEASGQTVGTTCTICGRELEQVYA